MNAKATDSRSVWIVIVNYNSSHLVKRFVTPELVTLFAGCIIVENGSPQKTEIEALRSLASETQNVVLVEARENGGFGAGVNLGVASIPDPDWGGVWVLNPDLIVGVEASRAMLGALESGSALAILSPVILKPDDTVWFRGGHIDLSIGASVHWDIGRDLRSDLPPHTQTKFVSGAAPLFTREAWDELGGFREDLFLYWEDADLSIRALALGIELSVVNDALIYHEEGGSSGANGRGTQYHFYMQRNRLVVCAPHSSRLRLLLTPRGALEWARLLYRAASEPTRSATKLAASARGLQAGIRSARK